MDDTKTCASCGTGYPRDDQHFPRMRKCKDGLSCYCKPCNRQKARAWKQANIEKHQKAMGVARPPAKFCRGCGIEKAGTEFSIDLNTKDGLTRRCRACRRQALDRKRPLPTPPRPTKDRTMPCCRCGSAKPTEGAVCEGCENLAKTVAGSIIGHHDDVDVAARLLARWNEVRAHTK